MYYLALITDCNVRFLAGITCSECSFPLHLVQSLESEILSRKRRSAADHGDSGSSSVCVLLLHVPVTLHLSIQMKCPNPKGKEHK